MLDYRDAQLDRARERAQAELDALLEEWSSNAADQAAAAEAASRQRQESHIEWLRSLAGDDATTNVAAAGREVDGSASVSDNTSVGHNGPQQRSTSDPPATGLTAQAIASMSMADYAALRGDLGIGAASSMGLLD